MIKVIVLYPNGKDKTFNMDYYCNNHMPMIGGLLGDSLKGVSVDKGLGGGQPGVEAPYAAVGHLYFESMEAFQNSFGPNLGTIAGDVPNYTNIEPVVLISAVMI